jgi:hypothetical protein
MQKRPDLHLKENSGINKHCCVDAWPKARAAGAEGLFETAATKLSEAAEGGQELTTAIREVAAETGLSVDQVISLAEQQGFVTGEIRKQVELLREQAAATGQIERSAREIARENEMLRDFLGTAANSLGDMDEIAVNFASNQGIALERVIDQALQLNNLTDLQREQLETLRESTSQQKEAAAAELERAASASSYGQARERAQAAAEAEAEAAERAAEAEREKTRQLEQQQRINNQYLAARGEVLSILESEMTETEKIRAQIDYLNAHPWAPGILENDRLRAIEILQARIKEINKAAAEGNDDREEAAIRAGEIEKEFTNLLFEQSASRIEILERERDRRIAEAEAVGAETLAIREFYQNEINAILAEQAEEEQRLRDDELARILAFNEEILASERRRIAQINEESRAAAEERIRIAQDEADEKEAIEKQLQETKKEIVGQTFDLLSVLADRAIEDEVKRARVQKAISIAEATINTAESVTEFLSSGNVPLAIAAGILGALQIATIAATPIPGAQMGGSFMVPPGNNDDSGLLRVNSGERVDVTPARDSGSSVPDTIVVRIGDAEFDARVERAFNKGSAQIRRRAAIRVGG